jgi:cytochrome c oxidase subunit I
MTILNERPTTAPVPESATPRRKKSLGAAVVNWVTSTDHKLIGYMYLITSVLWFFLAGLMALVIRAELAIPGMQVVSLEQYNQLFTMHGTIMLFLFATPLFVGFGNVIMPLQIGAPDVAFPRLNMFGYWLFLFGGLIVAAGFFTPGGAAARLRSERTCGSWVSPWVDWARFLAQSTSSRRFSPCGLPA